MKRRTSVLVLAFAAAANVFAFSKYPMMKNHRIECALARGSADSPAARFPLEVSDRPRAFWWDDVALHAGDETLPWTKLGVTPKDGAEFTCALTSDEGKKVELFCQLKEKAARFSVPSFGILGNRTITNEVTITAQTAGSVGLRFNAVGARTPRFIREYTRRIGANETARMEILGKAADSGNCFVDLFDSDGGILFMAFYKFHDPAVRFAYRTITSDLSRDKLRLMADQWFEPGEKNVLSMRMKDLRSGVDSGWSQHVPLKDVSGIVTTEVDVKDLPAGIYRAEYEVRDPSGRAFVSDYAYYAKEKNGVCDWMGTNYGLQDEVPSPWTTPVFRTDGFDCWNRTVAFGGAGLLTSVISAGKEFLAGPVQLLRNGTPLEFEVRLVEAKVARAAYRLVSKDASVTVDLTADFDGFMWFDVRHDASGLLSLRIPVLRERVVGFDDCSSPLEKLVMQKGKETHVAYDPEKKQWWWLGGTEGLMGGIESLRGWRLKDRGKGYVFAADDKGVTMTMNFVDTPAADGKMRTLGFYLMPTPVKEKDADLALQLAQKRSKIAWATKSHAPFFEFVYPGWQLEDRMQPYFEMQNRGERVFWYTASKGVSPVCPWWGRFGQDWNDDGSPAVFAEEVQPKSREQHERQVWRTGCMNSKSFFEQKLWGYCKFIENPDYRVSDLYCDLAAQHRCRNGVHGCQWRDDFGKLCCDSDLRRVREYHQRLYKVLKKKNPRGAMIGHLQYQRTPSDVYFDWLVMGETYDRFIRATMSYYDVLTPKMMQIQYASRSSEVIIDMLPQIDRALSMIAPHKLKDYNPNTPENDRVNRHATAYFKIHDLAVTPQPRGALQWSAPDKVLAGFGARRRHSGYYHPQCPVSVSAPNPRFLYCLYDGNGKRLLILLNDTDAAQTQTVAVKGLASVGRDIFNGRSFDFSSGACTVTLPPRESLFVLFEPSAGKTPQAVPADGPSVVFLGDEYAQFLKEPWGGQETWLRYWTNDPYRAVSFGKAGDCTDDLLKRITDGKALEGLSPKAIVLLVGINDFTRRGAPVGDVVSGIRRILLAIRACQPQARTVLCAVFPRDGNPTGAYADRIETFNAEIQKFADGRAVVWCDFTDRYLRLGLAEGARVWTSSVLPQVNEILRNDGMPVAPRCRSLPKATAADVLSPSSVRPVSRIMNPSWRGENWWGDRFARNRDFIAAHRERIDFVFAGSSSVHFWESAGGKEYAALTNRYVILNCGYGGDMTQNLLWRFENGELDGYRAKGVVLSIGSNNNGITGAKVADTVAGIKACLAVIARKQPQSKVVLLAYQPRAVGTGDGDPAKDNGADRRNRETSAAMAKMADGKRIFFVDVYDRFLVDGKMPKVLSGDYLHPTEKGYAIIRSALEPVLTQIMEGK